MAGLSDLKKGLLKSITTIEETTGKNKKSK